MHLDQNLLRLQYQPAHEQPRSVSRVRRSELNFLSSSIPTDVNRSAFSDEPVSDARNPHSGNLINPFADARPQPTVTQPTVQSRLNDWVNSAPSAEEKAVRAELAAVFPNNYARINEHDYLCVEGDFSLRDTRLTALPDNLSVDGYFDLSGCTGLTALPDNLSVGRDLNSTECSGLAVVPVNLSVREGLNLAGCTSLTALPNDLSVSGDLNLAGCTGLTALPDTLRVGGRLNFTGCTRLTALPDHLSVGSDLILTNCTGLTALPDNLSVGSDLNLYGCAGLTALSNNLSVGSDLILTDCRRLTSLPDNLSVGSDLILTNCTGLTALPDTLRVGRDLKFSDYTGLLTRIFSGSTSLMGFLDNLSGSRNLNSSNPMDWTSVPNNLSVGTDLDLSGFTGLTALPDNESVNGDINLNSFRSMTVSPDNLSVGLDLDLSHCTNLTALPDNLSVGRNLDLSHCMNLTVLPDNLNVGRNLNLYGCTRLTALPNWVATLGRTRGGRRREVDLTNTGLSETVLNRLRALNNPDVRFIFGHDARQYQMFPNLPAAVNSWVSEDILQTLNIPSWNLDATQEAQLMTFLSRLHQTADAQNQNTRPNLQHRIQSFLIQMEQNRDDYRAQALERIAQGLESCDDRVILIMNDIEKLTCIREASCSENPEDSLRALGQSLLALEVVHRHAAEKCRCSLFVDPIEVYLALEIKLADALNLPVSTQNMLFERCANLTEEEITAAREDALATIDDRQQVNAYLEAWDPWQTYQRSEQARQLSWPELPHSTARFDRTDNCVISGQSLSELEDPVAVGQALYSLESFLTWWVQQGTDPATMRRIDLSALEAVSQPNS